MGAKCPVAHRPMDPGSSQSGIVYSYSISSFVPLSSVIYYMRASCSDYPTGLTSERQKLNLLVETNGII